MPQSNAQANTAQSNITTQASKPMSQYAMVQEAGFTSFNQFMLSYGLKIHDPDDIKEAQAILKALFANDK